MKSDNLDALALDRAIHMIQILTADLDKAIQERDEARRELERLYDEKFRGNGALDLLADLDEECGL